MYVERAAIWGVITMALLNSEGNLRAEKLMRAERQMMLLLLQVPGNDVSFAESN